jgi:hypothetical protein
VAAPGCQTRCGGSSSTEVTGDADGAPPPRPRMASSVPTLARIERRWGQFALPPPSAGTGATTSSPRRGSSPRLGSKPCIRLAPAAVGGSPVPLSSHHCWCSMRCVDLQAFASSSSSSDLLRGGAVPSSPARRLPDHPQLPNSPAAGFALGRRGSLRVREPTAQEDAVGEARGLLEALSLDHLSPLRKCRFCRWGRAALLETV